MLYHPFPRLNDTIRPVKEVDYAVTDSLWQQVPATFRSCQFIFSGNHQLIKVDGEVLGAYHPTKDDILSIADDYNIIIHHIDTLADIDRWIPFNRLMSHLPIYRLVSNEEDYLYISSQTGEILQYNTKKARLWAYVGAIPPLCLLQTVKKGFRVMERCSNPAVRYSDPSRSSWDLLYPSAS